MESELELGEQLDELAEPAAGMADELASENQATPYNNPVVECSSHNVIGVLDDARLGDCSLPGAPSLPNWQWHTMFEDFTPDLAAWTETLPLGLRSYCIYEYVGPEQPNPEDYNALFSAINQYPHMSIHSVAPDCRGEVVQGKGLNDPAVTTELMNAFHMGVDWVPGWVLSPTEQNRKYPEVAIVDTVSQAAHDDPQVDPANLHGEFMGDIVRDIACADPPQPDCEQAIRFHIAMPREKNELADWDRGGQFGTMGDFAMAVVAAVGNWREARLNDPNAPQRLVISASLGWVPEAPVTSDPNRGPVRALEEALYFAACNGAIVLAAAGNTTDAACGHDEIDPLAPATYELVQAPSENWCLHQGYWAIDTFNYPIWNGARPLVYAIGGLDGHDQPIPNARPQGMPGLAAYAANATVETPNGFTTPLTGTSVSTAVVAGIASLVWSYAPQLTPDEVMKVIRDEGYETGLKADFDFTQNSPPVRRASACAALRATCAALPPGQCPKLECSALPAPPDAYLGHFFDMVDAALVDPGNVVDSFDGGAAVAPVCMPPTWDEQIDPQPEHPACPDCMIDVPNDPQPENDVITMSLASGYKGQVLAAKLVTYDAAGAPTVISFDSQVINSLNSSSVDITRVELDVPGTVKASLSFSIANGSVQDGPIPVRAY